MNYYNSQHKAAADYEQKILAASAVLMAQLGTKQGFLEYYYKILPRCYSCTEAFEITNLLHCLLFGEEKFSSYNAFRHFKNK